MRGWYGKGDRGEYFVVFSSFYLVPLIIASPFGEFPLRLSRTRLVSMRMWVWSLAALSGLRIQHFCELWYKLQTQLRSRVAVAVVLAGSCSSNSSPSQGPSICLEWSPKKKKKYIISPIKEFTKFAIYAKINMKDLEIDEEIQTMILKKQWFKNSEKHMWIFKIKQTWKWWQFFL